MIQPGRLLFETRGLPGMGELRRLQMKVDRAPACGGGAAIKRESRAIDES